MPSEPPPRRPVSAPAPPDDWGNSRLMLYLYAMPVVGFVPALWTVYYRQGSQQRQELSRTVVILTLGWLITYVSLGIGAENAGSLALQLWFANSIVTSGYFLSSIWLMIKIRQRKPPRLPLISQASDRLP